MRPWRRPDTYNFSSLCILILEDNRFIRKIVRELCRSFGFPVIAEATTVDEAMSRLESDHFDLAICPGAGSQF